MRNVFNHWFNKARLITESNAEMRDNPININVLKLIVLEHQHDHFELDLKTNQLICRHVISPRETPYYTEEYFTPTEILLNPWQANKIRQLAEQCYSILPFSSKHSLLPPGCSAAAMVRLGFNNDTQLQYSNIHPDSSGFRVITDPVPSEFLDLYNLFKTISNFS